MVKILGPFDSSGIVGTDCSKDDPIVQQQFADEVNINKIVERSLKNGQIESKFMRQPGSGAFGDFSSVPTFEEANERIAHVQEEFSKLPAKIKDRFDNDPGKLIRFVQNEDNRKEAELLGLIEPRVPEPPKAATLDDVIAVLKEQKTAPAGDKKQG